MKIGFIIVLLVALAANVYVLWHVYQVLPLPTWGKWTVVVLMAAALVMMFTGIFGAFDRMPLWVASATYDTSCPGSGYTATRGPQALSPPWWQDCSSMATSTTTTRCANHSPSTPASSCSRQ